MIMCRAPRLGKKHPPMSSNLVLLAMATTGLFLRLAIAGSITERSWVTQLSTFIVSALGAWLVATGLEQWTPWWPLLPAAVAGVLLARFLGNVTSRFLVDAGVMAAYCWLALPQPTEKLAAALVVGYALAGGVADYAARRLWESLRTLPVAIAFVTVGALGMSLIWIIYKDTGPRLENLFHMGVMRADAGERIDLASGGVAWFRPAPGGRPALLLHGNHNTGSHQPSAAALRRALLAAGYSVLSVDHIGYGASPRPSHDAPIEDWDPLHNVREALAYLSWKVGDRPVLVVGHSMGTGDALRAVAIGRNLRATILFGSGLRDGEDRDEYWYQRFHKERRMSGAKLDFAKWRDIRDRYYDTGAAAKLLPPGHAPMIFVRFGHEHRDIAERRDALFDLITPPKLLVNHDGTSHYLNSISASAGLIVADVHQDTLLAEAIGAWVGNN
jgi:pimeloyl-ACP methyl ester carboxylesterase